MKHKYILLLSVALILTGSVVSGVRPSYSFGDDVFSELPSFPDDFYSVKTIYTSQKIMASQLNESYLQPEILPTWGYYAKRVYGNNSQQMGSYGVFCYPSSIVVSNVSSGDNITVSTLIYAQWGIRYYQGLQLYFNHGVGVNVSLVQPVDNNILLSPTSPIFKRGWMQIIEIKICVVETGEYIIELREEKPSGDYNKLWSNSYGDDYVTGFGMLSMRTPRFQVMLKPPLPVESDSGGMANGIYMTIVLIFMIVGYILAKGVKGYYVKRKMEEE